MGLIRHQEGVQALLTDSWVHTQQAACSRRRDLGQAGAVAGQVSHLNLQRGRMGRKAGSVQ